MKNVVKIFLFMIISLLFYIPEVNAVTEKQLIVGQMIADFAKQTALKYTDDFVYTYKLIGMTKDNEYIYTPCVDGIYKKCNLLGIKFSGHIYGNLPKEAGIIGNFEDKFAMYCGNYASFIPYHALGGEALERERVEPKWENLLPGDYVSIDFEGSGHDFIFVDDAGDDDPYTMRISECSGKPAVKYGEIKNFKIWTLVDIYRVSKAQAEALSYNIINASIELYDRLDHTAPIVNEVTLDSKTGQLIIKGTDLKPNNYENIIKGTSDAKVYIKEPVSEPANSGIVAYQITTSNVEPIENWNKIEKSENFNIKTKSITTPGTYYAWVLDVGGNTAYKEITVTQEEINNVVLTKTYKIENNYIKGISHKTSLEELRKNMIEGITVNVIKKDGKTLQDSEFVGTNMKLKIEGRNDYTLIVTGDITGSGESGPTDILKLKQHIVKLIQLDNNQLMAADIDGNNKPNATDLLKMKRIIVKLD